MVKYPSKTLSQQHLGGNTSHCWGTVLQGVVNVPCLHLIYGAASPQQGYRESDSKNSMDRNETVFSPYNLDDYDPPILFYFLFLHF